MLSAPGDIVINPVVGCHYFPPGLWLHRPLTNIKLYCLVAHVSVNNLPKVVTWQRTGLESNRGA